MTIDGNIVKSDDLQSALINLIDNKKSSFHGIAGFVKRDYELIRQAREVSSLDRLPYDYGRLLLRELPALRALKRQVWWGR